jgi:arsenate reductase (glutaredoxin)
MKKIYYLSTCDTCKRILNELEAPDFYELQDIKEKPLTREQLLELKHLAGSYESLFSKRARLYKERDLKNKQLSEEDFKNLLLEHYTFLKRPVIVNEQKIFIGNSKKEVAAAKNSLRE